MRLGCIHSRLVLDQMQPQDSVKCYLLLSHKNIADKGFYGHKAGSVASGKPL